MLKIIIITITVRNILCNVIVTFEPPKTKEKTKIQFPSNNKPFHYYKYHTKRILMEKRVW